MTSGLSADTIRFLPGRVRRPHRRGPGTRLASVRSTMRFLHTADWHLGRLFHGVNLTEDQRHLLEGLLRLASESRVDAVLVAGDIYDRAVPPAEAVDLLDEVLSRLVLDLRVPVVLIAGNHDSPQRLSFLSRLLESNRLHVLGALHRDAEPIVVEDGSGPVCIHAIPYADPAAVRGWLGCDDVHDHEAALRKVVARIQTPARRGRSILVAHAFVAGGEASESERPLSVGGAFTVSPEVLSGFDYVALGHLHRPQCVGTEALRYSGSLMKYSFSEASHKKAVLLVEMDAQGRCRAEAVSLSPRRDLRVVEGHLSEILAGPGAGESREDYIAVRLRDTDMIFDVMGKLRQVYPNVLHVERLGRNAEGAEAGRRVDHRKMSEDEIFRTFYREVAKEELTERQASLLASVVEGLRKAEREDEP